MFKDPKVFLTQQAYKKNKTSLQYTYILIQIIRDIDKDVDILVEPGVETEDIYLLVLVLSAPTHWEERRRIRRINWRTENTPGYRGVVKHVFILGTVQDAGVQV